MSQSLNDCVLNAPERQEYSQALNVLQPILYNLPFKVVLIDGKPGVGKTTLGRFLAWRFNISVIETDLFFNGKQGSYSYRLDDIRAVIEHRRKSDRPIIIEGVVALSILEDLGIEKDFYIHVTCEESCSRTLPEYSEYLAKYAPVMNANLVLELPVLREDTIDELNISVLDSHPTDAVKLFKMMMRFEFALKELGFTRINPNGNVGVDWNKFANESLTSRFYDNIKSNNLATTLIAEPPSHQREKNGVLEFVDAASPTDVQALIGALCRVRNNLFHGGKSGDKDQGRNDELVHDALNVINEAVKSREDLKAIFEGRY